MDIDLLSRMVKELILDCDEVSLPGVGCFVAEMVPSTFSDKGYTINPPYRRLYFRQRPGEEDTALARLYSSSNNIDYADAERIINDFLSEMKDILQQKKTIVFPGLGRLRATRENNFFFVPDEDLDIYPAGFGLEPVSLKTHEETTEEVSQALDGFKAIIDNTPDAPATEDAEENTVPVETAAVIIPLTTEQAPAEEDAPAQDQATEEGRKEDYDAPLSRLQETPAVESPAAQDDELPREPVIAAPLAAVEDETAPESLAVRSEPIPAPYKRGSAHPESRKRKEPKENNTLRIILIVLTVLVLLALIALAGFLIASRLAPEWLDTILYSPEELEILKAIKHP